MMNNYPQIIENSFIDIHNKPDTNIPFRVFENNDDSFGLLDIKIRSVEITRSPVFIILTIDKSGSMIEYAETNNGTSKRMTKIEYVVNTCKNAVKYLSEQNAEIYLEVHTFNHEISVVLEEERITPNNFEIICELFDEIECDNSTNIGLALNMSEITMSKYSHRNPTHKIMNLFMTDGEATAGIREIELLNAFINNKFHNIFVGFGKDHNPSLLKKFAENKKSEYHVVDNFENTGLVYCNAIYKVLYPAIEDIKVVVENGKIYDWKSGKWTSLIEDDVWISDVKKIYHIRTDNPVEVTANIYGIVPTDDNAFRLIESVCVLPVLSDSSGYISEYSDMSKYMFRQKVQEILFDLASNHKPRNKKEIREEKIKLRTFFGKMHKWMRENNYQTNPFMLLLCEDIAVVYKNLNKGKSMMCISARQTSQGTQQSYTACSQQTESEYRDEENEYFRPIPLPPSVFQEQHGTDNNFTDMSPKTVKYDDIDTEDDINSFMVSENQTTTCYATPQFVETTRYFTM